MKVIQNEWIYFLEERTKKYCESWIKSSPYLISIMYGRKVQAHGKITLVDTISPKYTIRNSTNLWSVTVWQREHGGSMSCGSARCE